MPVRRILDAGCDKAKPLHIGASAGSDKEMRAGNLKWCAVNLGRNRHAIAMSVSTDDLGTFEDGDTLSDQALTHHSDSVWIVLWQDAPVLKKR
jgi:hypothetical protein